MYLLYVDESGDVGLTGSPGRYFVLSGFVVHELRWLQTIDAIIAFRKSLRDRYGLKLKDEIHAQRFIHKPGELARIPKSLRLRILRDTLDFQASLQDVSLLHVAIDKSTKATGYEVFEQAWMCLVQRFHNTIAYRNFPGPQNPQDLGMVIADQTDDKRLRALLRKLRRYNPVPNQPQFGGGYRQILLDTLTEDPVPRDSRHSYFIQLCDVNSYFLTQKLAPCGYVKKQGARNYFDRLEPIFCRQAAPADPQGVKRL